MALILLVEDEAHIAEAISYNLEAEQHEVEWVDGRPRGGRSAAAPIRRPIS